MRFIFLFITGLMFSASLWSQTITSFKESLTTPTAGQGKVSVIEHGDAGVAVRELSALPTVEKRVRCYRLIIFSDNGQDARAAASLAAAKFRELYPDTPVTQKYEAPSFKVIAGNFISHEDAIILWASVKETFKGATIISENTLMSAWIAQQ